jgi:hypothetical protein
VCRGWAPEQLVRHYPVLEQVSAEKTGLAATTVRCTLPLGLLLLDFTARVRHRSHVGDQTVANFREAFDVLIELLQFQVEQLAPGRAARAI